MNSERYRSTATYEIEDGGFSDPRLARVESLCGSQSAGEIEKCSFPDAKSTPGKLYFSRPFFWPPVRSGLSWGAYQSPLNDGSVIKDFALSPPPLNDGIFQRNFMDHSLLLKKICAKPITI